MPISIRISLEGARRGLWREFYLVSSYHSGRWNTHRLRINFPFRWFRFSLWTWATAALTWAKGEHAGAEPERRLTKPEHPEQWARLSQACAT